MSTRRAFTLSAGRGNGRATPHRWSADSARWTGGVVAQAQPGGERRASSRPVDRGVDQRRGFHAGPARSSFLGIDPVQRGTVSPYPPAEDRARGRRAGPGRGAARKRPYQPGACSSTATQQSSAWRLGHLRCCGSSGRRAQLARRGLIRAGDRRRGASRRLRGLVVADLTTAQKVLHQPGRLSRVDLIVPTGPAREDLARFGRALPAESRWVRPRRGQFVGGWHSAFDVDLTAMPSSLDRRASFSPTGRDDVLRVQRRAATGCCGPSA